MEVKPIESQNAVSRRDLLFRAGAGMLALGLASACAPILPMTTIQTTGDQTMQTAAEQTVASEASFQEFLPRFEEGTSRFINGDATLWKEHVSKSDDAIIMGAWGAYEQGWDEVGPRYDWAAARFQASGAKVNVTYLASGVSGNLAYTIANERSEALIVGEEKPAAMSLRVTHLYRFEEGDWKLILRHADPLMEKTAPDTVLQK